MAKITIDIPKDILVAAIDGAISLRRRNAKSATNPIIREALEKEEADLVKARASIEKQA